MFVLGRTARTYARLAFAAGPGGQISLPTHVDWSVWPAFVEATLLDKEFEGWQKEHAANIHVRPATLGEIALPIGPGVASALEGWDSVPWHPEFDAITYEPVKGAKNLEPADRSPAAGA